MCFPTDRGLRDADPKCYTKDRNLQSAAPTCLTKGRGLRRVDPTCFLRGIVASGAWILRVSRGIVTFDVF